MQHADVQSSSYWKLRQEDHEVKVSFSYTARLKASLGYVRSFKNHEESAYSTCGVEGREEVTGQRQCALAIEVVQ